MTDSALLKVDWAAKYIGDLNEFLRKKRPFSYVVQTDTKTGHRVLYTKDNIPAKNLVALICGDAVHNIRSALDHAYWEIVSPRCLTDRERRALQFPFTGKADRLDEAIQKGLAHRAGTGFYCALRKLRPHGEPGGNELLYVIHDLDIFDKHRLLIPTVEHIEISDIELRRLVPDFPFNISGELSQNVFHWNVPSSFDIIPFEPLPLNPDVLESKLDIPLGISFPIGPHGSPRPMIPTLDALVDVTRETIKIMRAGAASY